jgi:hypothetical protein
MKIPVLPCRKVNFRSRALSNKGMVKRFCRVTRSTILLSLLWLGAAAVTAAAGDAPTDLSVARQALNAALAAEARAAAEYQRLRQQGTLSPSELDDYRTFLARLDRMVRVNCKAVARLKAHIGDMSPEPNCERGATTEELALSFPNEQTEGERTAVLERRLGSSLSEFDEMLLREMEQLARTQSGPPDAGVGSGPGTGDQPGSAGAGDGDSAHSGEPGGKTSTATDGRAKPTSERSSDRTGTGAVREAGQTAKAEEAAAGKDTKRTSAVNRDDVPDAGDDDVVARQLREAAENETDPELRKKLWQEYKRYKSGKAQAQ